MFGLSSAKQMQAALRSDQKTWSRQTISKIPQYLLIIAFISAFIMTYKYITSPESFPIHHVQIVDPQQRIDHKSLQNLVMPEVLQGFFHVDVQQIQQVVTQLPWVETAVIKRVWPDRVVIRIIEKQAEAHWNQQTLISGKGDLFSPTQATTPKGLPQLQGRRGSQVKALEFYRSLQQQLTPLALEITHLRLSDRGGILLQLNHQFTLNLGERQQQARLQQFIRVYPRLFAQKVERLKAINMQYHHGMAVEWRSV